MAVEATEPRIGAEILSRLRCPTCGQEVAPAVGALACPAGHAMPVTHGYVDALGNTEDGTTARTFKSFGYEWTTFSALGPEDEQAWAEYFADVDVEGLRGKVGLDAGCGKGRFSFFTAAHLGSLVALDGSDAVEAAVANLRGLDNVVVVKSDIRSAPFVAHSFDFISCLGVLHHLADPEDGFRSLVGLLAADGQMLLYLYSRPETKDLRSLALAAASRARVLTVRMPHRLLRAASAPIALALYSTIVVPGRIGARAGVGRLARLPLAPYRNRPVRSLWLDTFDRLSAPVERRYVWSELEGWFSRSGLRVDSVREHFGYYVLASRP